MQKVDYTTTVDIPLERIWDFIKDYSNWAPMVKGYQTHEVVSDSDSIWTIRGEFGPFSRVTKFHTTITEWVEREKVGFEMKGLNEPVTGFGVVNLTPGLQASGSTISAEIGFAAGGVLGPLVGRLVKPWVNTVAEELVEKLVAAINVTPSSPCPSP